jgi:beta-N-acetylhexosaminidase
VIVLSFAHMFTRGFVLFLLLLTPLMAKDKFQRPGPAHLDRDGEKWAEKTLKKMSDEDKVGQLFMVWVRAQFLNVNSPAYLDLKKTIDTYHVGSFAMTVPYNPPFLSRSQPFEAADLLNRLQKESPLPLIIAADFERGVTMRLQGATEFPHAMAFGAAGKTEYAEAFGRITGLESRAIGVHWNFFPVADVNSNPVNPIINTRSFGENPQLVGDMVAAYIKGAHSVGMLTTAKHFPGHGDTATDSHLGVAQVTGNLARLEAVELPPFKRAIDAGVDAVMVAHVSVPALEPRPDHVATTSPAVVTDLLKGKLGFQGLVVTDALDMAALTKLYEKNIGRAAVDAFKAGNDVLIIPADFPASYRAMLEAVKTKEIPQAQLDAAVLKILKAKASLGLNKARLVDLEELPKLLGAPENAATAQRVAEDAIALVRDNGKVVPLKPAGTVEEGLPYMRVQEVHNRTVLVVFSDDVRTDAGRALDRAFRARIPDARVIYVDPRLANGMAEEVLKAVDEAETVVTGVYVIPTAGRIAKSQGGAQNSVGMADASGALLQKILDRAAEKTVVLAMGNPYLASDFPAVQNYICSFSNAAISEVSTVKALFGEIEFHGRLPVSIPGIVQSGFGMDHPAKAQGAHNVQPSAASN